MCQCANWLRNICFAITLLQAAQWEKIKEEILLIN